MKFLIKLAQVRDIFVIDLVEVIKLTQIELHEMFLDPSIAFKFDSFVSFQFLVEGNHETFLMRWIIDLNSDIHHLAFEC
jgi:hypothetical protein